MQQHSYWLSLQSAFATDDARSIIGRATMEADRTIIIKLWRTADGTPLNAIFRYRVDDDGYQQQLDQLGGLQPGESKSVPAYVEGK